MTPYETLHLRTLVFIAGQLMVMNAERLLTNPKNGDEAVRQLEALIARIKEQEA